MTYFTELNSWSFLEKQAQSIQFKSTKALYQSSNHRQQRFSLSAGDIHLDYANQRLDETTLQGLFQLGKERHLRNKIHALMCGEMVNRSELKPALHTALRAQDPTPLIINGHDIIPDIMATRKAMCELCESIRAGLWLGFSGKPITDIVNIGIGGSDLGPQFCITALADFTSPHLRYHFISDVDPSAFANVVLTLQPETTLFIIASKSFTTKETLYNAGKAKAWLGKPQHWKQHLIAVTANKEKAKAYGVHHILPIWDWVGGRYSVCSAINLITAIAIGFDRFNQLLSGAHQMDLHFKNADLHVNMPVILALIGIWNINFLQINNLLLLTYAKNLSYFLPYIQQLDMESNGKSIDNQGRTVNYDTGPIIWGGLGNHAQHSYYQLLCQGTHKVTLDFITLAQHEHELIQTTCRAKMHILAHGYSNAAHPNHFVRGNNPFNHLTLSQYSPATIGALIALYEHKIYAQSVIWDINPFDQPGVESAKQEGLFELLCKMSDRSKIAF